MKRQLIERLDAGPVTCAEGFLFEVEKRGYLASGDFVPRSSTFTPSASFVPTSTSYQPTHLQSFTVTAQPFNYGQQNSFYGNQGANDAYAC